MSEPKPPEEKTLYRRYRYHSIIETEQLDLAEALSVAYYDYESGEAVPHEIVVGETVYDREYIKRHMEQRM